jgi:tRNA-dihydrouridine synthase
MATPKTLNIETAIQLNNLQIPWVDLNFGCPSNRVNSRFGGAALLAHPEYITKIIRDFREHYQGFLSIKIRAGFQDSDNFQKVLQICKQENVDCLTVHGRLQTQQYLGKSNWNYIVEAKKALSIPIIGNGDVWTVSDYQNMTNETKCNAVMIGRGALKTPWFPKLLKQIEIDEFTENKKLFRELLEAYLSTGIKESSIVQRFKGFAFFMFEKNLKDQTQLMQSQTSAAFFSEIDRLFELKNKREIPE